MMTRNLSEPIEIRTSNTNSFPILIIGSSTFTKKDFHWMNRLPSFSSRDEEREEEEEEN